MTENSALVIGSKEHLKIIRPFLSKYFNGQGYIFCDEYDVCHNPGKWKFENILKICTDKKIGTILFATGKDFTDLVTNKLRNFQGDVYYIPQHSYPEITNTEKLKEAALLFDIRKPCLNYIEFQVNDHCNLNCKGCTHFSNLESGPNFADIDQYTSDLKKLSELFWNITTIRLMGGEPLLNPELWKFIDITRKVFPAARLRVASNGLLVPKMSDKLVEHMKDAKAGFDITNYPPTRKMSDKILSKLNSEKIDYDYYPDEKTEFYKILTENPVNDKIESFNKCPHIHCKFLRNGTLSICPFTGLIDKYNNLFGTDYPADETNVLSEIDDGWELYEKLYTPISLCEFCCTSTPEIYEWEVCNRNKAKADDWIVKENMLPILKKQQYSLKHPYAVINHYLNKHDKLGRYVRYCYYKIRNII